jgi:hypothetical protein
MESKNNNALLLAGIGGGVLLLLSCCCVGGVGGWFLFARTPSDTTTAEKNPGKGNKDTSKNTAKDPPPTLDKLLVGRWQGDAEANRKNLKGPRYNGKVMTLLNGALADFRANGTQEDSVLTPYQTGNWKTLSIQGDTLTIEIADAMNAADRMTYEIKFLDNDHIRLTSSAIEAAPEHYMKRAK